MSQKPPLNPNKGRVDRIRSFDGIGGPEKQVLKRTNARGNDISNTIANVVQDMELGERGSMWLRAGMRKIDETGKNYDISSIFDLHIGGTLQYGLVYNGSIDLVTIPDTPVPPPPDPYLPPGPPLEFTPEEPTKPADYPADWDWPEDVKNDYIAPDPSLPPQAQVCPDGYTIVDSPAALTFTMSEGGSNPDVQYWYFKVEGRWQQALSATFSSSTAWYNTSTTGIWAFTTGPCNAQAINQIAIQIDGSGLAAGAHTDTLQLEWTDGTILDVAITLTVTPVATLSVSGPTYQKKSNAAGATWAAVVTNMENDTATTPTVSPYTMTSPAFKVCRSMLYRYDTSAYNGSSFTTITVNINSFSSYAGQTAVLSLQAQASGTLSQLWSWWSGGVTGTIGVNLKGSQVITLDSTLVADDWLFLIYRFSPFAESTDTLRPNAATAIILS